MPKVSNSKTVNFAASRIYGAVVDVESYPRILHFIHQIKVLEKTDKVTKARVLVGLPMFTFSYDCIIHHKEPDYVRVELISGPFKRLKAHWQFEAINETQCKVHYSLDSEFSNPFMEMTAGAIFASQINHSIKAFEDVLRRS